LQIAGICEMRLVGLVSIPFSFQSPSHQIIKRDSEIQFGTFRADFYRHVTLGEISMLIKLTSLDVSPQQPLGSRGSI
jgi:hypothetical protein